MPFIVAVFVSAWYGGLKPGLVATILSTLAATYFQSAAGESPIAGPLIIFTLVGLFISGLSEAFHVSVRRAAAP
jgi:hypothetical protein